MHTATNKGTSAISSTPNNYAQAQTAFTATSTSGKSIAFLQPIASPSQATVMPLNEVLQRLNEEQTNKTKKLLSDLSSKRRTRQRKPIMVVNSGHTQPRHMLPKMNHIINGQSIIITNQNGQIISDQNGNLNSLNTLQLNEINSQTMTQTVTTVSSQQQQIQPNIVFSGPIAAVRQIVNNGPSMNTMNANTNSKMPIQVTSVSSNSNLSAATNLFKENTNISPSSKAAISSFHQAYSNLIPQILSNLMDGSNSSNEAASNIAGCQVTPTKSSSNQIDQNNLAASPSQTSTLADMSLLELSLNNADSLFGNPTNMINNTNLNASSTPMSHLTGGNIINPNSDGILNGFGGGIAKAEGDIQQQHIINTNKPENHINLDALDGNSTMSNSMTSSSVSHFAGLSSASKLLRNFSSFLNENSISLSGNISQLCSDITRIKII